MRIQAKRKSENTYPRLKKKIDRLIGQIARDEVEAIASSETKEAVMQLLLDARKELDGGQK